MLSSSARTLVNRSTPRRPKKEEKLAPRPLPPLEFSQASDWEDVRDAFRLLYQNYHTSGLVETDPVGLRYTHYNLLPETAVFVAKADGRVIATFSLIVDSKAFGLPMDELYAKELEPLRREGRKVGEISGLAIDPQYRPISIHLLMNLVKMLLSYAMKLGVKDLAVACHPKHARFYKRLFLFEEIGEFRTYKAVNDAPAIALRLDLTDLRERYRVAEPVRGFDLYRFLFSDEIFRCPPTALRVYAFSKKLNQELLSLRPELMEIIECKSPGMVAELTGRPIAQQPKQPAGRFCCAGQSATPALVPA